MNKLFLILIFSFNVIIHFEMQAQVNLVPNPSFEELDSCEQLYLYFDYGVVNWYNPGEGTSDMYNACIDYPPLSVPINQAGNQDARTGFGYAGVSVYADIYFMGQTGWLEDENKEYIQVELNEDLIEGAKYRITFFASLGDSISTCVSNGIGAYASSEAITSEIPFELFDYPAQISYSEIITDSINWTEVTGEFVANGDERFLTIGCFKHDAELEIECISDTVEMRVAYYYIDDVSLTFESFDYQVNTPNVITPNNDGLNDFFQIDLLGYGEVVISIYNRWGNEVFKSNNLDITWSGNDQTEGVYFYHLALKRRDKTIDYKKGYVQLIK